MAKANHPMPSVSPAGDYVPSVSPDGGDENKQKGTPELMNVSPVSGDLSPEQTHASTLELLRQNEWLRSQKQQLEAQILSNQSHGNEDIDLMSEVELKTLYDKQNAELAEKTFMKDSREIILRGERLKQLPMSILFCEPEDEVNLERKRELEGLMEEFSKLCSTVAEGYKQNSELRQEVDILRKQNFELLKKSRQVYEEIDKKKKDKEEELKALTTDERGISIHEQLQIKLRTNTYLRHILQGLILGSGLNWAEDDKLQNLLLKAGSNVQI